MLESFLHVQPDCAAQVDERCNERLLLTAPTGRQLKMWTFGEAIDSMSVQLVCGDDRERRAWFSPVYGRKVPSRAIKVAGAFKGRGSLLTCLSTSGHHLSDRHPT